MTRRKDGLPTRRLGPKRSIVSRSQQLRGVIRTLECGHEQREPDGGEARNAHYALCRECLIEVSIASNFLVRD